MRTEVTFLSRVIVRIDEDCIVGTRGHASFAADTDRFIKIDDAICSFEHCGRRTCSHTRCVTALIAACDLVRAARLWKDADVDVFDVSARDGKWDEIFRLARSCACMTTDTARVVDYLGPLDRGRRFHHRSSVWK